MSDKGFLSAGVPLCVSDLSLVVGVVISRFNSTVTLRLAEVCVNRLLYRGLKADNISKVSVPGSLEIPYALSLIASGHSSPDVLVAIGSVIRGDTFHFDVVAIQSASSIYQIQMDTGIPVINGILTTDNLKQANDRITRGAEFADCAVEMAVLRRSFKP